MFLSNRSLRRLYFW